MENGVEKEEEAGGGGRGEGIVNFKAIHIGFPFPLLQLVLALTVKSSNRYTCFEKC